MRIWPSGYRYDVFLSHAASDSAVADVLYRSLTRLGLKVWYAKYEVPPGGGLEGAIPDAMARCRFAVALVTEAYLREYWTMRELTVFGDREAQGVRTLFTVLQGITNDMLRSKGITLGKEAILFENNPDEIARRVLYQTRYTGSGSVGEWILENSYALRIWSAVAAMLIVGWLGYLYYCDQRPCGLVETMLTTHIEEFETVVLQERESLITTAHLQAASIEEIKKIYERFTKVKSRYSNVYELSSDGGKVVTRARVEQLLKQDPGLLTPANVYNLPDAGILATPDAAIGIDKKRVFVLSNPRPVQYEIVKSGLVDQGRYEVIVAFKDNIRLLVVELDFPDARDRVKHQQARFMGFEPQQTYAFVKNGRRWVLRRADG
jgi:hypothetical protein